MTKDDIISLPNPHLRQKSKRVGVVNDAIEKIGKDHKGKFNIIHAAVGDVGEGDVSLAVTTKSNILGLHVKAEPNALLAARQANVIIQQYGIIYKLLFCSLFIKQHSST